MQRAFHQPTVRSKSSRAFRLASSERWGIKNDQVKRSAAARFKKLKNIALHCLVLAGPDLRFRLVERKIATRSVQSMPANVDIRHCPGASARRIQRKAACKAEQIQHILASGERLHSPSILSLVEEKSGFLSTHHFGFKLQAGFEKHNRAFQRPANDNLPVVGPKLPRGQRLNISTKPEDQALRMKFLDEEL
jgi:hypothetical protein